MSDAANVHPPEPDSGWERAAATTPRIMVSGSRGWTNEEKVRSELDRLHEEIGPFELMHGGAQGPDNFAYWWALEHEDVVGRSFLPNYQEHGKAAPHVRNDKMLDRADRVIAFWNGVSRGTKSVIDKARKRGLEVEVVQP